MVFHEFCGTRSELDFLKFIAEHAQVLEKMAIVFAHGYSPSDAVQWVPTRGTKMASSKWRGEDLLISVFYFSDNVLDSFC
jgi:hypothetical protein